MRIVTSIAKCYICNSPNCCHPSCWETIRKLMNGILIFNAENCLWKRYENLGPRLTNYAYYMTKDVKIHHVKDTKGELEFIHGNDQEEISIDKEYSKISGEHLLTLNSFKNQLNKWNHMNDESQLRSPYVWIPSNKSENRPLRRKRSKRQGCENLLFMLASRPEKCQSFVRQKSLSQRDTNEITVNDDKVLNSEQNDTPDEMACMPRWIISCHLSDHALRTRLLPMARTQLRRRICYGNLIVCANISNPESDKRSEKQTISRSTPLTKISSVVGEYNKSDQQIPFTRELTIPNQKLISLNESLKSNKSNVAQHQHSTPHYLNELIKSQCSGNYKRKFVDTSLCEKDELKAKTRILSDLSLFEQSRRATIDNMIDNMRNSCANRCYTSPINWSSLLHNNAELNETNCSLDEPILPSLSQGKIYLDNSVQSNNLLDKDNSISHGNGSLEDSSDTVAVWQTMPGRFLRRAKTQNILNTNKHVKNGQTCTNNSKGTKYELQLNLMVENVSNEYCKRKSLYSDKYSNVEDNSFQMELSRPTEDTHQQDNDDVFDNKNRHISSYWTSRRHPGYIERMHTLCLVSGRRSILQDNNSWNNYDGNYITSEKSRFSDNTVDLITLKPKTKPFLPQIRQSESIEKHKYKNMLKRNSREMTSQTSHSNSLPMLIQPPPPSPDVKFIDFL
ncbi:hypothetical protein EWB00_007940 [Schistosoma japonicum]|uniref:Uncharacterized protein n=1 Tax=Schistosoma japonicum TaxID=6182 RepID=A0A4Z2CSE3_SCHJA|nr:hypothetical protein EWB00_007940 [Schistosoma japonicum]